MRGSATLKHPPPFLVPCKAKFDKVWFVVNPFSFLFCLGWVPINWFQGAIAESNKDSQERKRKPVKTIRRSPHSP